MKKINLMIVVGVGLSFLLSGCSEKTDSDGFPKCGDEKVLKEAFGSFEKEITEKNEWVYVKADMHWDFPKIKNSQWDEIAKTVKFDYKNIRLVETNSAKTEKVCECDVIVLSQSELLPKDTIVGTSKKKYRIKRFENGDIKVVNWLDWINR